MGDDVLVRGSARITLVEANADLRSVVTEILQLAGYDVCSLSGEGLEAAAIAETRPDVTVLDLGLEGASEGSAGWQWLQCVRSDALLQQVPTLICSADLQALRRHAGEIDSDPLLAALEIPFGVEELEEAVSQLLDRRPAPLWDDGDLVLVADEESRLLDASRAALRLLGFEARELRSLRVADIVAHAVEWTDAAWERYRSEGRWMGNVALRAADGRQIVAYSVAEIMRRDGRLWHISRLSLQAADPSSEDGARDTMPVKEAVASG